MNQAPADSGGLRIAPNLACAAKALAVFPATVGVPGHCGRLEFTGGLMLRPLSTTHRPPAWELPVCSSVGGIQR